MTESAYPRLRHMFGGYFHQDWGMEGNEWPDLIRNYHADEPLAELDKTADEIGRLLADFPVDAELNQFLWSTLGCYYMPRPDMGGPTVREWLTQVTQFLRHHAKAD